MGNEKADEIAKKVATVNIPLQSIKMCHLEPSKMNRLIEADILHY